MHTVVYGMTFDQKSSTTSINTCVKIEPVIPVITIPVINGSSSLPSFDPKVSEFLHASFPLILFIHIL